MSGQPLLFNVESIYDMRNQLVEQSVAIIKSSVVVYILFVRMNSSEIGDAIENDRLTLYVIHSAEDYFGSIAKFQLLDEAPTVMKYHLFNH